MTTPNVVREAQSVENYDPTAKQKAAAKLSRIPVKVEAAEVLKKTRLDPWQGRLPDHPVLRNQGCSAGQ
jgi:hypothetical protein